MAKANIFTRKEIQFLRELVKHKVEFMIVGLSAATLQGAPVVTQDIDLWFQDLSDPNFQKALKAVGGSYIPPLAEFQTAPKLVGKNINLFDIVTHMHGLKSFEVEAKQAKEISLGKLKVQVLSLEQIIKSKKAANRQKDKLVLPVLKDVLKVIKATQK